MPRDTRPPAFLFYPDDFSSDGKVEAMTTEEVGAYMLLLCKAWREEPPGSLPNDDDVLARWARLSSSVWAEVKARVLAPFSLGTDNRWYQGRMRREFEKLASSKKRRAAAAKTAALSRWSGENSPQQNQRVNANRIANASESHPNRNANAMRKDAISSSSSNTTTPTTARARDPASGDSETEVHWAIVMYSERFGHDPSVPGRELIAAKIVERDAWEEVLNVWHGNGHDETRVGNMVSRYEREVKRLLEPKREVSNGRKPATDRNLENRIETERLLRLGPDEDAN